MRWDIVDLIPTTKLVPKRIDLGDPCARVGPLNETSSHR